MDASTLAETTNIASARLARLCSVTRGHGTRHCRRIVRSEDRRVVHFKTDHASFLDVYGRQRQTLHSAPELAAASPNTEKNQWSRVRGRTQIEVDLRKLFGSTRLGGDGF